MTDNIDTAGMAAGLRHCILASGYDLRVDIVDEVSDEGEQCTVCQEIGRTISACVYYSYAEPGEELDDDCRCCCLGCIFPFIDSIPWLNIDKTITLEVSRGGTNRPF